MPQNTEKLPKTANFLSKKLSVYNTHENRYLRGPQFNIDIMLNNILCIVYISTCFAKIGISRFLVSIEEKDYRDVSKVVLLLLYPSMFTLPKLYMCTLPSPCFLCFGVYRFCVLFFLTPCHSTYHDY